MNRLDSLQKSPTEIATPPSSAVDDLAPEDASENAAGSERENDSAEVISRLDRLWLGEQSPWRSAVPIYGSCRGQVVAHFELQRVLGTGAFGVVYLARDQVLDRLVALKLPRPEVLLDRDKRARFANEANLAAKLNHPDIVPIYEANLTAPVPYLTSEFCDGPNLAEWISDQKKLPDWKAVVESVLRIADAVEYAHGQSVHHRDLKPANILLVSRDSTRKRLAAAETVAGDVGFQSLECYSPRLTDFGLAKIVHETLAETHTSMLVGTLQYMAPEQLDGSARLQLGAAVDVYSLGVILFELLTGRLPHDNTSYIEALDQIRAGKLKKLRQLRPDVPRCLDHLVSRCLAVNPAARYQSAGEFADDLRRCAAGEPISNDRCGLLVRVGYWCERPARISNAGSFAIISNLLVILWLLVTAGWLAMYGHISAENMKQIYQDLLIVLFACHGLSVWLGWLTLGRKGWAIGLNLILSVGHAGFVGSCAINGATMFKPIYANNSPFFSFEIHFILLILFGVQSVLYVAAAMSMWKLRKKSPK